MPREGYRSTGSDSLPEPLVKAIDKLKKDPKFIAEMHRRGIRRISRALVIRIALTEFLEGKGITDIYEAEGKQH